jgi:hypothetical protein
MIGGSLKHIRQHFVAYVALFFALGGTSWAVSNGPPYVSGGGEIVTGSIAAAPFTVFDHPGLVVLTIEGFGNVRMDDCQEVDAQGDLYGGLSFENTSSSRIDVPGSVAGFVDPGQSVDLGDIAPHGVTTQQLAKGSGDSRTVVSLTASTFGNTTLANECRAQAQATIQTVNSGE